MNKYLVVVFHCEEETYLFDTKNEMLNFFNVKSIKDLVNMSNFYFHYTVYEISNIWSDE